MEAWKDTEIEKYLFKLLKKESHGNELAEQYKNARRYLNNNIYGEIKGVESSLTDHSGQHIENVLDNAWKLIRTEELKNGKIIVSVKKFNAIDLYLLCMSILLHDVGNIHGRKKHNENISDIYNKIVLNSTSKTEKRTIMSIVNAHCGQTQDGKRDTLGIVEPHTYIYDHKVSPREIASIVRFADELAEGKQRTSQYMLENERYDKDSKIYHYYASIVEITIDKSDNRIMLTYNINYPIPIDLEFEKVMSFVFTRIIKLDSERKYCKYYSSLLDDFKETEAQLNFYIDTEPVHLDLPKITLCDKYCLDENQDNDIEQKLTHRYPAINIPELQKQLIKFQSENNNRNE